MISPNKSKNIQDYNTPQQNIANQSNLSIFNYSGDFTDKQESQNVSEVGINRDSAFGEVDSFANRDLTESEIMSEYTSTTSQIDMYSMVSDNQSIPPNFMPSMDENGRANGTNFLDINGYKVAIDRIDKGYETVNNVYNMIKERINIENDYAKKLYLLNEKYKNTFNKSTEYGTSKHGLLDVVEEAKNVADIHSKCAKTLRLKTLNKLGAYQKEHYKTKLFATGFYLKTSKKYETQFKTVQKPWAKMVRSIKRNKKLYYSACKAKILAENDLTNFRVKYQKLMKSIHNIRTTSQHTMDLISKKKKEEEGLKMKIENQKVKLEQMLNNETECYQNYKRSLLKAERDSGNYVYKMTNIYEKLQNSECHRLKFLKETLIDIQTNLQFLSGHEIEQIYYNLDTNLRKITPSDDVSWWHNNSGMGIPPSWPVFEEYDNLPKSMSIKKLKNSISLKSFTSSPKSRHTTKVSLSNNSVNLSNDQFNSQMSNEYVEIKSEDKVEVAFISDLNLNNVAEQVFPSNEQNEFQAKQNSFDESADQLDNFEINEQDVTLKQQDETLKNDQVSNFESPLLTARTENDSKYDTLPVSVVDYPKIPDVTEIETLALEKPLEPENMNKETGFCTIVKKETKECVVSCANSDSIEISNEICKCRVLYDYNKNEDDELSIKIGMTLMILKPTDSQGWCLAENEFGETGLIPGNYVEILS